MKHTFNEFKDSIKGLPKEELEEKLKEIEVEMIKARWELARTGVQEKTAPIRNLRKFRAIIRTKMEAEQ